MARESVRPILTAQAQVNGIRSEITLTEDGTLRWEEDVGERRVRCVVIESEVLGFEIEDRNKIRIRCLVRGGGASACCCVAGRESERVRKDFFVEMETDRLVGVWEEKLREIVDSLGRPRRLFVIINPFGGKKGAPSIFNNEVKPLLTAAGVKYVVQETEYPRHAQDLASSLDLLKYDGIVCVSGDGVLVEVLNGLLRREDWTSAVKMPLGIIPAGTGNGMAMSILNPVGDACTVSNAVLAIIRGHKTELDIATVSQGHKHFFSLLMLSWGLISDIDIESEKYRWMGSARLDIYPLIRIMNLRKYYGHISFVPAPGYESHGKPLNLDNSEEFINKVCDDNSTVQSHGYQGPQITFRSSDWRTLEGPFVSIWLHNVPWSNGDVMAAPDAKFSDGYYDMIIIMDCPRSALLALVMKMKDGSYVKSPYVTYLKVKAFRLVPGELVGNPAMGGIIDCDGEVLARGQRTYQCGSQDDRMTYGPLIELQVDRGLATIFSPQCDTSS